MMKGRSAAPGRLSPDDGKRPSSGRSLAGRNNRRRYVAGGFKGVEIRSDIDVEILP